MKIVSIKEILKNVDYPTGGGMLFKIADEAISNNEIISVDLSGIESLPILFMNTSFGDLISKYGIEKTKKSFSFSHIKKSQLERISKYFKDYEVLLDQENCSTDF